MPGGRTLGRYRARFLLRRRALLARTVLRIRDDGTDAALFRVRVLGKVLGRTLVSVDADAELLRVFALVDGNTETVGDLLGLVDGVLDPAIPRARRGDENELCVVHAEPDHDRFGAVTVVRDVLLGGADPYAPLGLIFEWPCSVTQITSPPSTHRICPVM